MKKLFVFLAIGLILSSNSFAGDTDNTTGGAGSALELNGLVIGVSPDVYAYYADDGNAGNSQWFGIATAHKGGDKIFGAAQNNSATFFIDVGTNTITGPLSAGDDYNLPNKDQAASTVYWSTSDWDR